MRKEHVILLALILFVFLAGAGVGYGVREPKTITVTKFEYVEVPVVKHVFITEYERNEIEEIANGVAASHFYIPGVYDCSEFSEELVRQLRAKGYECEVVYGTHDGKPHAWVRVTIYVEATNGHIISPSEFKNNYTTRAVLEN